MHLPSDQILQMYKFISTDTFWPLQTALVYKKHHCTAQSSKVMTELNFQIFKKAKSWFSGFDDMGMFSLDASRWTAGT